MSDMPESYRSSPPAYTFRPSIQHSSRKLSDSLKSAIIPKLLQKDSPINIVLSTGSGRMRTYSTNDEISGYLGLKLDSVSEIIDLNLVLEGVSTTFIEDPSAPRLGAYVHSKYTFLKLAQIVEKHQLGYSDAKQIEGIHTIPFSFILPNRLLPNTCSHKLEHPEVKTAHLRLPPSLGDLPSSEACLDDMAPDMVKISYAIKARVTVRNNSGEVIELDEKTRRVRIIPAVEEQPPTIIDDQQSEFCLRQVKSLKRGIFPRSIIGQLVVEMTEPSSFRLPPPNMEISSKIITTANIALRFEPHTGLEEPPRLHSISSKIHVYTFFGAAPYSVLPLATATHQVKRSNMHGVYSTSVNLSCHNMPDVLWQKQEPSSFGFPINSPLQSDLSASSVSYTGILNIPLTLPHKTHDKRGKIFVPSFYSCKTSRCYSVSICLSFSDAKGSVFSSQVKLKSPVQISSEGHIL